MVQATLIVQAMLLTVKTVESIEYNIDEEFKISNIPASSLLLRRLPPAMLNGTGPAMREKVYKMQKLYQKHKSQVILTPIDTD